MVLKKPGMERCGLPELGSEVGLCYEEQRNVTFSDLGARVLSKEQVEFFIHDAYATYRIAGNLLKLGWDSNSLWMHGLYRIACRLISQYWARFLF